jgi:hypothetical protein
MAGRGEGGVFLLGESTLKIWKGEIIGNKIKSARKLKPFYYVIF